MTATRRIYVGTFGGLAALVALGLGTPALSQNSESPVAVTAAPPPSAETVGPSQLRDFSLEGTVTRPSDGPAAASQRPATTAPAAPRPNEAVPGEPAAVPAGDAARPVARPILTPASPTDQEGAPPAATGSRRPVTPSQPLEVITDTAPQPGYGDDELSAAAGFETGEGGLSWPWILALLALAGGGAFIGWSRYGRRLREADPVRMAFAGPAPDSLPQPRAHPPSGPRADPVPPRAGTAPEFHPNPVPQPPSKPAAPPRAPDDGLVTSTRFRPELNILFAPDRVVVTETEAILQFEVVIANSGSAPARDVLVEARMFTAHSGQDREIAGFFQVPQGTGDRIPAIAPLGRLQLKSAVRMSLEQLSSFEAGGRRLFVPLVGFNILFRTSSGEEQVSASFLVGRGSEEDEKLAPFRVDLGPGIFRGLSARRHSLGLQPA